VRFFDVDESNEVAISLAGSTTESPAVTANNKWGATTYHIVPGDGGWIEFSNTLVDDDPMTWGVQFTHTGRALRANQVGGFSTVSDSAWDEAAVRRVLHTFAWGGHPKEVTIRRWANLPPRVAITQMLNFQHHNLLLYMTRSNKVPWSEKFLYRDDWAIGLSVASLGSMRGLNPFRTRIGVWETNYHMATNLNAGVEPHQMVRYYDDILSSLEKNEPYQNTLAAAASTAAIAKQYAHNESRYYADEDFCECNEDFAFASAGPTRCRVSRQCPSTAGNITFVVTCRCFLELYRLTGQMRDHAYGTFRTSRSTTRRVSTTCR